LSLVYGHSFYHEPGQMENSQPVSVSVRVKRKT
jgi:hypothetical protein